MLFAVKNQVCKKIGVSLLAVLATVSLSACAGSTHGDVSDPIEGFNRGVFKFNEAVDTAVIRPVAKGYQVAVPQPARSGVRNFLHNLKTPTILANNLLQGDVKGAGTTTVRFLTNTLIGVGGLFDVASKGGLTYKEADFGQTLGKWGVGNGAYLVLPLLGPSTARDAVGTLVDGYADPVRLWMMNTDREAWYYSRVAVATIDKREELMTVLDDLKKNSIDYYAALRSAYVQRRAALVNGQAANGDLPDMP